jgi:hypothetical protein
VTRSSNSLASIESTSPNLGLLAHREPLIHSKQNPSLRLQLHLLAVLFPLVVSAQTYNLENLALGPLVGQDGWVGSAPLHVVDGKDFNISNVLTSSAPGTSLETPLINSRVNNASFSFPTLSSTDKQVILQLDYRVENNMAELWFGVGVDLNKDGAIEGSNERGFGFGHYHNGVGMTDAFALHQLNGSLASFPASFGDTIRLRMVVDMTGFNGESSANLYYQNLSTGASDFTLLYDDQNLDIRDTGHTPEEFNGVFLALSSGAQADNFTIVPEPSSGALLCGGGLLTVLRRRRTGA